MTTAEIISSVIALFALIVSAVTAYLTLFARFQGHVIPKHRAILTQINMTPCLVLECEFVNDGAKPGSIEDILVNLFDENGNRMVFTPFLIKEEFNVFQKYQIEDFVVFSGISLGAKHRRNVFVVFRPSQSDFKPEVGMVMLRINICTDILSKKWNESVSRFSLNLEKEIIKGWIDATGKSQQITAIEIGQSRREFLKKNQK